MSSFADVEFGAFGAMDDICNVILGAVELFNDVQLQPPPDIWRKGVNETMKVLS